MRVGFVYVLTNPSFPAGYVKVGRTMLLAEDRAADLFTTGLPFPYDVAFRLVTSKPAAVERRAHDLLASTRVAANREFFKTTPEDAADKVRAAAVAVGGIEAWDTDEPVVIREHDRIAAAMRRGQALVVLPYVPQRNPWRPADVVDYWQAPGDGDVLELLGSPSLQHVAGVTTDDPGGDLDPVPYLDRDSKAHNDGIIGRERLEPGQRLLWVDDTRGLVPLPFAWFELHCHCQVVARSVSPQLTVDGFPVLFHNPSDAPSRGLVRMANGMLRLGPPDLPFSLRTHAAALAARRAAESAFGTQALPPEDWLRQLGPRHRRKRPGHGLSDSGN